ncbi:MAG: tetratricopeptide repeat protein [Gemmataceae bacterium]|nr:tetratricopeptide repeat protein [Gemmataceae bacterium]
MKRTRIVVLAFLVVAAAMLAWIAWRWWSTPPVPVLALKGADEAVVALVRDIEQELRREPRAGAIWGKLALALIANDFLQPALDCLDQAVRLDPRNPTWSYFQGHLRAATDPSAAEYWWQQCLDLVASGELKAAIYFRLAQLRIEHRQFAAAEKVLEELTALEPESERSHWLRGLLYAARDEAAAARAHLQRAAESPFVRQQALRLLASLADIEPAARQRFEREAADAPADQPWPDPFQRELEEYVVNLSSGLALLFRLGRQGRVADARRVYERLTARGPNPVAAEVFGQVLFDNQQFDEAERVFTTCLAAKPKLVAANFFFASNWLRQGEAALQPAADLPKAEKCLQQALEYCERVLAVQPDHAKALVVRGRSLRLLGRHAEALAALRQALVLRPETPAVHLELGETLASGGKLTEGLRHLEEAARLAPPDHPLVRAALERWRPKAGK